MECILFEIIYSHYLSTLYTSQINKILWSCGYTFITCNPKYKDQQDAVQLSKNKFSFIMTPNLFMDLVRFISFSPLPTLYGQLL